MREFFRNFWNSESAFRAMLGGGAAYVLSQPETFGTVPWLGPAALALALLVKAGDKNAP